MLSTIICYLPTLENNMIFDVTIFIKDFISFFIVLAMVIVNKRYMGHINHGVGGGDLTWKVKNQSHCVINHARSLQICSSDINCFIMSNILSCRRKVSNKGGKKEISTAA